MLEGIAMPSSRRSSQPGDETRSPHCGQILRLLSHEASSDVEYNIYPLVQTFLYVTLLHTHVALILSARHTFCEVSFQIVNFTTANRILLPFAQTIRACQ